MPLRSHAARLLLLVALVALYSTIGGSDRAALLRAQGDPNVVVPAAAFDDLKWRLVGATRGGRVTAYSGVRQQPHTFYMGATGGGVWKTEDAGITWTPLGDGRRTRTMYGSAPGRRRSGRT